MQDSGFQSPVNPLPPVVILLFVVMTTAEILFSLGESRLVGGETAIGWRMAAIRSYGFSGEIFDLMLERDLYPMRYLRRIVTYPFIHLSFYHALFAIVMLLALGKWVGEAMGQIRMAIVFFSAVVLGAIAYAVFLNDPFFLVGAYPGVYGLIGAYSFIMWRRLGYAGEKQYLAFTLIGMLMALQLVWSIFGNTDNTWVADLVGFIVGFAISFLLAPGEWGKILKQLRQR